METLWTERLELRGFQPADAEDLYAYAKGPRVGPNAGWKPHERLAESKAILKGFIEEDEVWALVLRETGRVVGSVGLHRDVMRAGLAARKLGYVLAEAHWGLGLMPEAVTAVLTHAFDGMGLEVVEAQHYPQNQRSRRVIEKSGFVYEGTLRHASRVYDGTVRDLVCYSMLKSEFAGGV